MRQQPNSKGVITRDQFDAVLFDLDGVITDTANLHAACWKEMFDEYLENRAVENGEVFRPFDLATDYLRYVDGKPRFDGVRDFLRSRGIQLADGDPKDPPERETVCGLGNRKNDLVNEVIAAKGVAPYEGSVRTHPSASPSGLQNRRRNLKSKLRSRVEGRQVGLVVRGSSRRQHDPGAASGRETCPRYLSDGGKATCGGADPRSCHRGRHIRSGGRI